MKPSIVNRLTSLGISAVLLAAETGLTSIPGISANAADITIEDFGISAVTMTDEYSVNAFRKEVEYLLSFDNDRLLAGFRENAGLNTKGAKRYGGWENTNIAGHAVGHYLTALAQAYQNPSLTEEQRSALYKRMTTLLDGLRQCQ